MCKRSQPLASLSPFLLPFCVLYSHPTSPYSTFCHMFSAQSENSQSGTEPAFDTVAEESEKWGERLCVCVGLGVGSACQSKADPILT